MRGAGPRCSSEALALGESMEGTASRVRNWILVEQPGPWGYHAPLQSRLPAPTARALHDRARALHIRIVLIRRPGRSAPKQRSCYLAHTGPSVQRLERVELRDPAELLDLDWAALVAGGAVTGQEHREPVFLVCTNGARDRCCAERGRAVAGALAHDLGDAVWECSHIGGDRFAGNVVCFPHGIYYGRVAPHEATRLAQDYTRGMLDLHHYRGRSCYEFAVQAAESFLRTERGLREVEEVRLIDQESEPGRVRATFATSGGSVAVTVAIVRAERPRRLTCQSPNEVHPPRYQFMGLSDSA